MTSEISNEAARWLSRMQSETVDEQTIIEWQQWITLSEANRIAYNRMEDILLRARQAKRLPALPTRGELARDDYDGSVPIREWKEARVRRSTTRYRLAIAATVTVLSLIVGVIWTTHHDAQRFDTFTYSTNAGQRQIVALPDGSRVTLDADSSLKVQLSANMRLLWLTRGEAFFEVKKDRARPFTVRAGSTEVTAVGTAFNVHRSENRTVVAVTEGKVEVVAASTTPLRLTAQVSAGEAVSYIDDGNTRAIYASDASVATTWLAGRRQYRAEPLRYVLADIDRYTGGKIELADEAAGELRFSGTLNLENSAGWLRGLSIALPVSVTEKADGTISVASRSLIDLSNGRLPR